MFSKNVAFLGVMILTAFVSSIFSDWKVEENSVTGTLVMRLSELEGDGIPFEAVINLDNNIQPVSVSIEYPNGHKRVGTKSEMGYFWHGRDAQIAAWKHLHANGKVNVMSATGLEEIPNTLFNRPALCLAKSDIKYMGRLEGTGGLPEWFALIVYDHGKANRVLFYLPAVKEVWSLN